MVCRLGVCRHSIIPPGASTVASSPPRPARPARPGTEPAAALGSMDVGTARALLSLLQAAAAAPPVKPAQPTCSGGTRKRYPDEEAAADALLPLAPPAKQPRLDSSTPLAVTAAEGSAMPLPGLQSSSQLALVLQLSGSQQQHGAVPPKVAAVLSALPLAKKQALLLALLRKQTQDTQRAQPQPQALPQPQPQTVPLVPTPTQPNPSRPVMLPPPQPRAAPQQQQKRRRAPALQLAQQQQVPLQALMGGSVRQHMASGWAPGSAAAPPVVQAQQQPTAPPTMPPAPQQRPVRPTACRGSPSITQPLFLRVVQERALAAAGTSGG